MYLDRHMIIALNMAKLAFDKDEVPIGAIVVKNGTVIGKGYNKVVSKNSISCHAEILAINEAVFIKKL